MAVPNPFQYPRGFETFRYQTSLDFGLNDSVNPCVVHFLKGLVNIIAL